mmetsp:Transcript_44741/g.124083  ORF Transcript_44741/g.124083 Transcript_44741/m.124083 type:complete len:316 (+) Transcript_44741:360-1307(+)
MGSHPRFSRLRRLAGRAHPRQQDGDADRARHRRRRAARCRTRRRRAARHATAFLTEREQQRADTPRRLDERQSRLDVGAKVTQQGGELHDTRRPRREIEPLPPVEQPSEALRVHQVEAQRGRGAAGGLVVGGEGGVEAHECKYHVVRARRDRARAAGGHRQEAQVRAEHESHVERRRRERKRGAAMRYDLQVAAGAAEVDELLEAEGARPAQVAHGVVRLEAERLLPVMVEARKGLLRDRASPELPQQAVVLGLVEELGALEPKPEAEGRRGGALLALFGVTGRDDVVQNALWRSFRVRHVRRLDLTLVRIDLEH